MPNDTILFRARVPAQRYEKAQVVLNKLGLKPSDALNMMLAQIELQQALPFEVTTQPKPLLTAEEQGAEWTESFGAY